jgi:RNA polymerase sigma-70 factor (ECF subfamily)
MMTTHGEDEAPDRTLAAAAQTGDGAAFLRLVARYRARLEATLRDRGNPARAADLAQDAIDMAYDEIADLRDPNGFYPWLRRIATTRLLKDIRQRGRRQVALDRLRPHLPRVADPLVRVLIRETAAELSPELYAVLVLRDDLGYTIPEIAVHLGISENATRKRLTRAREEFRRRYADK